MCSNLVYDQCTCILCSTYSQAHFTLVPTESSTTGDSCQQDGGDIGSSFIDRLPDGVTQQCKLCGMLLVCLSTLMKVNSIAAHVIL